MVFVYDSIPSPGNFVKNDRFWKPACYMNVTSPSVSFKCIWFGDVYMLSESCLCGSSLYQEAPFSLSCGIKNELTRSHLSLCLLSQILLSHICYALIFLARKDCSFHKGFPSFSRLLYASGETRGPGACGDFTQSISQGLGYELISVDLET